MTAYTNDTWQITPNPPHKQTLKYDQLQDARGRASYFSRGKGTFLPGDSTLKSVFAPVPYLVMI